NERLRSALELSNEALLKLMTADPRLAGNARYLRGDGTAPGVVRAILQQVVQGVFSGSFCLAGDFSVRRFVQQRAAKALFIEYDVVEGARLAPMYGVLMDLAIKEALRLGQARSSGKVFVVLDELSLLPRLSHLRDGIGFGHTLGLRFILGTQDVDQV